MASLKDSGVAGGAQARSVAEENAASGPPRADKMRLKTSRAGPLVHECRASSRFIRIERFYLIVLFRIARPQEYR